MLNYKLQITFKTCFGKFSAFLMHRDLYKCRLSGHIGRAATFGLSPHLADHLVVS